MKKTNFKKMIQDMTFQERASLLFADTNLKYDSKGKETAVTHDEKREIIELCRKEKSIEELNRLSENYNLGHRLLVTLHIATLTLELAISRFDIISLALYLQTKRNEGEEVYFSPKKPCEAEDFEEFIEDCRTREPDIHFQMASEMLVAAYLQCKQIIYGIDKLYNDSNGVDLFSDRDLEIIQEAEAQMELGKKTVLSAPLFKMFREFRDYNLMRKKSYTSTVFEGLIASEDVFLLSPERKQEMDEAIHKEIHGYPIT